MFLLRLLGAPAVIHGDRPLRGRAFQRRRLALLALLGLGPQQGMSRHKLLALLWPRESEARARHRLAVAVYELRAALGHDALVSAADRLWLERGHIRTDVDAFRSACATGAWEQALAVWGGTPLDGFYIAGAPAFEEWVEQERARLERAHGHALEAVAAERAVKGDLAGAADAWWERAATNPGDTRCVLAYMRARAAAGDRPGAAAYAQLHAAVLRRHFGLDPDPAVAALAQRLRAGVTEP